MSRNIEKRNEKSNNLTGNKTYRTFTYTSSKQDNLNSGRNNTSIIITSSKMNEDANNALNKGRIHHMISVRNPNIRSNSTSSNDYLNKNEDKASNTTNNGFRNRAITIISSTEYIDMDKNKNNNKEDNVPQIVASSGNKREYIPNSKNTNLGRIYITNFNIAG